MVDVEAPLDHQQEPPETQRSRVLSDNIVGILLIAVLSLAAYLRFTGLNWDSSTHLHPDERFLTMVETSIRPPKSIGEYFNTEASPLNPHNVGHGFFVYGSFPIFLVRYLAEWTGMSGYDEVHLLGRAVSGISDLVSILLIYLIGDRLFSRRVGILAALFTALSVLLIQHAHFFVVDPLANVFILAGLYFSVRIIGRGKLCDYLLFGVMLGLAVTSKISAAPLAVTAALAGLTNILSAPTDQKSAVLSRTLAFLLGAAFLSLLVFRVFQPYAFEGPGFFDVRFNPKWLANMAEVRSQQAGNTDAPYALQWANRAPVFFSLRNMILWGLGIPLGILGWVGLAWALVEMIRGRWKRYLIPVVWTAGTFIWQSINFTKAMRYQLPVYPTLALLAAWALWHAWESVPQFNVQWRKAARVGVLLAGSVAILGTALWAFAFHSIYSEPLTRVSASRWIYRNIPAVVNLVVEADGETFYETIPVPMDFDLNTGETYTTEISTDIVGVISSVVLPYVSTTDGVGGLLGLSVTLADEPNAGDVYARGEFRGNVLAGEEAWVEIQLDQSFNIDPDIRLFLILENIGEPSLHMRPSHLVHETTWDDGLPWGVDGRGLGGRYEVFNLELYWHDNQDDDFNGIPDKLERIVEYLEGGDYLTISSNRQYGTIPRVPIRYPLTAVYYRELFGCPDGMDIPTCGATAEVGLYSGRLGYSLVEVFESHPSIGALKINDQFAEEAFTVYDHPKVLIFKRDVDFSAEKVFDLLSRVDVSGVVHVLPKDVIETGKDLLLSTDQWQRQQEEGTWSEIFNTESLVNRSGLLSAIVWWMALGVMGLLAYPITRVVFRSFHDGGYALSRLIGLLLFSWGAWTFGSLGVTVSRLTLVIVLLLFAGVSFALALRDREEISTFFRKQWRDILWVEVFALSFFLFDLAIRFGNPDLWHPAKGGEKPMDFSYLNAVIKSSTFPPYDPWFAGGYINYYYYGFVIVGMPVKLLGIVPATAYNLIIPTLFSILALCAYSMGYHLVRSISQNISLRGRASPKLAGIIAALLLVVFGNLGTARMFYDGFKQIGTPAGVQEGSFIVGAGQAAKGFVNYLTFKSQLPYPMDQWYWNPSRMITPGEGEPGPITEFPFFTFLYADLHAHMISRSLTILSLAWGLSWILSVTQRRRRGKIDIALALFVGGLALGALRPINTWDFPVYWVLGVLAVILAVWWRDREFDLPQITEAAIYAILLLALSQFIYQPYHWWYGQGYMSAETWKGSLTPLIDYLTVHGVFLFLMTTWMVWETREWMAQTPISELNRLRPMAMWIGSGAILIVTITTWLAGVGYQIALIVLPLATWALILLLRPDLSLGKRIVLFLVGTGLVLTFVVEIVVLKGDLGRMNTVFKFYLQVWELFSLAAAAALAWTYTSLPQWDRIWRWGWLAATVLLLFSAALYPLTASIAKVRDRMTITAPRTLDGMLYMDYVNNHFELGEPIPLGEDYQAIRWMQENIEGSPVIVEANIPEYRWGGRYSIYTGLPGVLGWRWHQTQQRVAAENTEVDERLFQITNFYLTRTIAEAQKFLAEYNVKYVVVGGLERAYYAEVYPCWPDAGGSGISCDLRGWPLGMPTSFPISPDECELERPEDETSSLSCSTHALDKFASMESKGSLQAVFREGNTVVYEVVR